MRDARLLDNLAAGRPAFARAIGCGSAVGELRRVVDKPEEIFEFTN